jgi:hypothetical protein
MYNKDHGGGSSPVWATTALRQVRLNEFVAAVSRFMLCADFRIAACYLSITKSARSRNDSGIVNPSASAGFEVDHGPEARRLFDRYLSRSRRRCG